MRARLLVIQHEDECPPGWFGEWLEAAGIGLDVVPAHHGAAVPRGVSGYDGLVVLGGEMGAYDDDRYPWLTATRRLVADAVAAGLPFLGVCLGHQLAAVALSGTVEPNPDGIATGLTPVVLTETGVADPLLGAVRSGDLAVQWNEDIVSVLPPGAVVLARAPDGSVQAARFGAHAWGVQFHPEVSPEIFDSWTVAGPKATEPRADGVDVVAAATAVRPAGAELRRAWQPLADRFAEVVVAARDRSTVASP